MSDALEYRARVASGFLMEAARWFRKAFAAKGEEYERLMDRGHVLERHAKIMLSGAEPVEPRSGAADLRYYLPPGAQTVMEGVLLKGFARIEGNWTAVVEPVEAVA